jgi:hypothetical protein
MAIAIAFNVLIYQFLEELPIHSYAVGHDHTRIPDHRLTHQAHTFPAKASVPLGQILTDRIAEAAPGKDLAQPGHRLQAVHPGKDRPHFWILVFHRLQPS